MKSEWDWEWNAEGIELVKATDAFTVFDIGLLIISSWLYDRIWFCDIFEDPAIKIIFKIIIHTIVSK